MSDQETLDQQIEAAINNEIAPYIQMDGGEIYFVEMKDNVVFVEGMVLFQDRYLLYYGTADTEIGVARSPK